MPPLNCEVDPERVLQAFDELMNGPFGPVVASLIGEAQENEDTRAIVATLIAPYGRYASADQLGGILFRRLLGT